MRYINYDVVFILPAPSISYPPGGYDVVYRLAQALNKENIRTSIIFLKKPEIYIDNYIMPENLKNVKIIRDIFYSLFNGKRIKLFYNLHLYRLLVV